MRSAIPSRMTVRSVTSVDLVPRRRNGWRYDEGDLPGYRRTSDLRRTVGPIFGRSTTLRPRGDCAADLVHRGRWAPSDRPSYHTARSLPASMVPWFPGSSPFPGRRQTANGFLGVILPTSIHCGNTHDTVSVRNEECTHPWARPVHRYGPSSIVQRYAKALEYASLFLALGSVDREPIGGGPFGHARIERPPLLSPAANAVPDPPALARRFDPRQQRPFATGFLDPAEALRPSDALSLRSPPPRQRPRRS
jgi:hypothetical protein